MNSVNATLRDRILLRTHYLSRFENTQRQSLLETLQQAHDSVVSKIATTGGKDTKAWLDQVLLDVDGIYAEAFRSMGGDLNINMKVLSKLEAEWAASTMEKTIPLNVSVTTPSPAQVWAAVTTSPADRGHLLSELMDGMERGTVEKIRGAIRQGVVEGETIDDMVKRIRGTVVRPEGYVDAESGKRIVGKTTEQLKRMAVEGAARKIPGVYQGGAMATSTRTAEALARTAVMHVSNVARGQVNKENADLLDGEQWVATLDTRTCAECGPEDGKVYPVGEGPVPPYHINCRCLRIPIVKSWKDLGFDIEDAPPGSRASMDGQVPDSLTYGQWLRTQSSEVQNDALGPGRAELFRNGMSVDRFIQDGRVLRLDELGEDGGSRKSYEPQDSLAAASRFAVDADLADHASYKGASLVVANEWNRGVHQAMTDFPELRKSMQFIGTTQERQRAYVEQRVPELMASSRASAFFGDDEDSAKAWATKQARREAGKTPGNTLAYSVKSKYASGISVNSKYASDPEKMLDSVTRNIESGWFAKATPSIRYIVDHELGHEIDRLLGVRTDPRFQSLVHGADIDVELSKYAATSRAEVIAEAWAEYTNSANPRPLARSIGDLMKRIYNERYGD